ncbi:MAG: hypothetical protein ACD_76C00044G0019 [uncultured bacterium]|nr:MAG: hypothetical protein ACD_76C00044G0019 [uncultured bacterium]
MGVSGFEPETFTMSTRLHPSFVVTVPMTNVTMVGDTCNQI